MMQSLSFLSSVNSEVACEWSHKHTSVDSASGRYPATSIVILFVKAESSMLFLEHQLVRLYLMWGQYLWSYVRR